MSGNYPTLDMDSKQEPFLPSHQPTEPPAPYPPAQQPGPWGTPPSGYQAPPPMIPPPQPVIQGPPQPIAPPEDDGPFKIKGVVELQKEFNAEEVKIVKKQPHILSLVLNLLVGASRLFIIFTLIGSASSSRWRNEARFLQEFWWIFALVELVYFVEFFCSSTLRYLWNKTDSDSIRDYVVKIKETRPSISMWCECYHFETRVRYVTESYTVNGPNGPETRTRQRMETYQEKVVTYTETDYFDFSHFFEISRMISDDIYDNDLIKIKFSQKIEFGDPYTRGAYDRQLSTFIARNKNRDACFTYTENKHIPGFKERMFSVNGEKHSCLIHWWWYTVATILGLTWPFRLWVESKCVRGEFNFHSVVFRDPHKYGF